MYSGPQYIYHIVAPALSAGEQPACRALQFLVVNPACLLCQENVRHIESVHDVMTAICRLKQHAVSPTSKRPQLCLQI